MYRFKEVSNAYKKAHYYAQKKGEIPKFPPYITFELVNRCNFKCIMCPATYLKEKKKHMDFELFKKAVNEISQYGSLVRFIGYSEPLLYERIKDAIKYVKEKKLLLHITTNGSLLKDDIMETIINFKADSIIFSFQGFTEEEYCFMRNSKSASYEKVIDNIKALYKRKKKKPHIKITTTITERDSRKEDFIKSHFDYTDEIQITGFTHFIHIERIFKEKNIWNKLGIKKPEKVKNINCVIPGYELIIKEDGNVYPCCGSFTRELKIGNIKNKKIIDLWHSDEAYKIRKELYKGKLGLYKDCQVCPVKYKYDDIGNTVIDTVKDKVEKHKKERVL